jgi:hypothetical protein
LTLHRHNGQVARQTELERHCGSWRTARENWWRASVGRVPWPCGCSSCRCVLLRARSAFGLFHHQSSFYTTCHSSTGGRLKASDLCNKKFLAFIRGSDEDRDAIRQQQRDAVACLLTASANFVSAMRSQAAIRNLAKRVATLINLDSRLDVPVATLRCYTTGLQNSCKHAVGQVESHVVMSELMICCSGLVDGLSATMKVGILRNLPRLIDLDGSDYNGVRCLWAVLKPGTRIT